MSVRSGKALLLSALIVLLGATSLHAQASQWMTLLRAHEFDRLEEQTVLFQKHFASGALTEFDLREAYRPFYDMNEDDWRRLDMWQKAYPRSYAVPLIRGAFYKRAGFNARGGEWATETTEAQFKEMYRLHALARHELEESLELTEKPFLSVWHLIDLVYGDPVLMKELMDRGTQMLPTNTLIRARYMRALRPRWYGSYQQMEAFLVYARETGATERGLCELEAIICDDAGDIAKRDGDYATAVELFRRALELGAKAGGEVPEELRYSWSWRCHMPELKEFCR